MPRRALVFACLIALAARLHDTAAVEVGDASVAELDPFLVLVTGRDGPLCTGTLVAPKAVLTAASCAAGSSRPDVVFVGLLNAFLDPFRRPGAYEIIHVKSVKPHPAYSTKGIPKNDLALLVLDKPSSKQPAHLPGAVFAYPTNATAAALGFGGLVADGFWPQLHSDVVTVLPGEDCSGLQIAYGTQNDGLMSHACTGVSATFRACATGNLGAPLLMPSAEGKVPLQLGLLTNGFGCSSETSTASASSPALFVWLPRYAEWLQEQLASL